ncbi:hypothetical protein NQ315_011908 [Exocentrus adspersus]|uniref:Myb-like, SWIRM and MPN domain-containing protein 1 n=1 Tax=Exocentrus adspersus TaxID=1586481 RepID=A0AAV8W1W6_9CUCU|nr:hypothetical protein NQ315_011908 [Exocentrus adspersus]
MAEEDEIDILGEFNLDNFVTKSGSNLYDSTPLVSQNTELLNCDYTIHPQWLLDKPSANPDNWYDTSTSCSTSLDKLQTDNDSLGHVSTENCITDESGWTEKEKGLLDRGIEIFGKSNIRLAQFIGSKTSAEVKYYLKNFYVDGQNAVKNINDGVFEDINDTNLVSDVLDDTQIPASIEEVIEAVSTAKPTIQSRKRGRKKGSTNNNRYCDTNSKGVNSKVPRPKFKRKYTFHNLHGRNKVQLSKLESKIKTAPKESQNRLRKKVKSVQEEEWEFKNTQITTGQGLSVPISEGEEIIKIKKVDDESDLDVDVDVEDSDDEFKLKQPDSDKSNLQNENISINSHTSTAEVYKRNDFGTNPLVDLSTVDELTLKELKSLETPRREIVLDKNSITELERVIHNEFFEGRPVKTPLRYLKIRNYIINSWISQKPVYLTKSSVRQGLKKTCGDVNCIGRIHYFLEQIGAINFGCAQMNYVRPLSNMVQPHPVVKDKSSKDEKAQAKPSLVLGSRARNKRKFNNDGEGGCTLTHDESGHVINTTVVNEEPKQRSYIKKPSVRLVTCRPFTPDNPQPYRIKLHLPTLLKMDFHAHTSLTEIMGLIGGYWIPNEKVLLICHYEPCLNIASSATHCDMCPISQAKAADVIHGKGLDILGWFHSHPTFAPEPSHQDIETQLALQQWISHNKPCVGFILSPFSASGDLIASPFRCMLVDKKLNFEDQMVPYKFKVHVTGEDFKVKEFLRDIKGVREFVSGMEGGVDLAEPYFQDTSISYLEKYISSVRMHFANSGVPHKSTCDSIIQGIFQVCNVNTKQ